MNTQLRCVSYNVAGPGDMFHLLLAKPVSILDEGAQRIAYLINSVSTPEAIDPVDKNFFLRYATEHYKRLSAEVFLNLIQGFDPHLLCLQELRAGEDHEPLRTILTDNGYDLLHSRGLAIAFKSLSFKLLKSGITDYEEGALFADLKVQGVNKIVRIVSDHCAGFNINQHKTCKQLVKTSADKAQIEKARDTRTRGPELGDRALQLNLTAIAPPIKRKWFSCVSRRNAIDAIIYGLDANATARFVPKESRVHARRLHPFIEHGFTCDLHDEQPTLLDHHTHLALRYDYLFCKATKGFISIVNHEREHLNRPEMLTQPTAVTMSDHLPVLSTVTLLG